MTSRFGPPRWEHRLAILLVGASHLAGCFGRSSVYHSDSGEFVPLGKPEDVCLRPDGATCSTGTTCDSYTGYMVDEAVACRGETPKNFWVCVPPNTSCGDAQSLGRDASGQLWHFETTCVPPLFKDKSPSAYQPCTSGGLGGYGGQGDSW